MGNTPPRKRGRDADDRTAVPAAQQTRIEEEANLDMHGRSTTPSPETSGNSSSATTNNANQEAPRDGAESPAFDLAPIGQPSYEDMHPKAKRNKNNRANHRIADLPNARVLFGETTPDASSFTQNRAARIDAILPPPVNNARPASPTSTVNILRFLPSGLHDFTQDDDDEILSLPRNRQNRP